MGDAWTVAYRDGGTFKLYADTGIDSGTRNITENLVIDLNSHKLTVGSTAAAGITVKADASLTVKNGEVAMYSGAGNDTFTVEKGARLNLASLKVNNNTFAHSLVNNAGTLDVASDVVTTLKAGALVTVAKANSTTTLAGTHDVKTILTVATTGDAVSNTNPASTVSVRGTYTTAAEALTITNGVKVNVNANIESAAAVARVNNAELTVDGGSLTAKTNAALIVNGTTEDTKLTVNGGTITAKEATGTGYALWLANPKAIVKVTDGTFNSGKDVKAAINLVGAYTETDKDTKETHVVSTIKGILTGGRYLNNIIAKIENSDHGTVDVSEELVAEGYTVKEEGNYKVVVSTKAEDDKKPAAKPEEQAPNTYDAGLVYMGLALSAIGASVVSVRKLRNN